MSINKNIKCIPFPGIENAYVVISGCKSNTSENGIEKHMSFFFDGGDIGAEWEPDNGPITKIHKTDRDTMDAEPHWFYNYSLGNGDWAQMAVKEEGLPGAFLRGDYEFLFLILKKWVVA